MPTCPRCNGNRQSLAHISTIEGAGEHYWTMIPCTACGGTGTVTTERRAAIDAGETMRKARIAAGISLRDAAIAQGMSPTELSAIEHGIEI